MKTWLRWALILALLQLVWFMLGYLTGLAYENWWNWPFLLVQAGILYLALVEVRDKDNAGVLSYGQGVGSALLTGSVAGGVSQAVVTFLMIPLFATDFIATLKQRTEFKMEEKGMSSEQIDQAMQNMDVFTSPGMLFVFGLVFSVIFSLILALIIAAIVQRKPTDALPI